MFIEINKERPEIFSYDTKRKENILSEIEITSQDRLLTVETVKS